MVLLRRVIGDALRARRQAQRRTLREVSTAANVSLGYLSEIERGQKEASSELLAAICDALGARLSELLREVSYTVATSEQVEGVLVPVPTTTEETTESSVSTMIDGNVSVTVRQETPLKATLRATRNIGVARRDRDVLSAA
jgi:transcriptional regulator with XRE-family HTH domain